MIFAALTFFITTELALPFFGADGLWLAFLCYLSVRSLIEHFRGSQRIHRLSANE